MGNLAEERVCFKFSFKMAGGSFGNMENITQYLVMGRYTDWLRDE